jgi:hypothetical protein
MVKAGLPGGVPEFAAFFSRPVNLCALENLA